MAAKQANENEKENIPLPAKQGNADSQQYTSFVIPLLPVSGWVPESESNGCMHFPL